MYNTNLEAALLDKCPLLIAIATISLLMTSGGNRSIASNNVSSHALATTGSLLSMEVKIPLRKVLVNEVVVPPPPPLLTTPPPGVTTPVPPTKVAEVVEGVGWVKEAICKSVLLPPPEDDVEGTEVEATVVPPGGYMEYTAWL